MYVWFKGEGLTEAPGTRRKEDAVRNVISVYDRRIRARLFGGDTHTHTRSRRFVVYLLLCSCLIESLGIISGLNVRLLPFVFNPFIHSIL